MNRFCSLLWHVPGNAWRGALAGAPLTQWWRAGAGIAMTAMAVLLIWIIWKGPWDRSVEADRLNWLGYMAMGTLFIVGVAIVALMDVRVAFRASRQGLDANIAGDDAPPIASPGQGA